MSELTFDEEKHIYKLDGKRLTSVTTILNGGVPKQFLVPWAAKRAAEHAWELRDMEDRDRFVALAKSAPDQERDKAAVRGTTIHKYAEDILNGLPVDVPEELYPYVDGYVRFLDRFHVSPLMTERTVLLSGATLDPGAKKKVPGSGGRFDAVGHIPTVCDGPVLWDVKTSNGIYRETKLQTAAYACADYYVEPDAPTTPLTLPEIQATFVAHVTAEGTFLHPMARTREEILEHFEFFRSAYQIYKFGLAAHKVADPIEAPSIEFEVAS